MRSLLVLLWVGVSFAADTPREITLKYAQAEPEYALRHLADIPGEVARERILRAAYTVALAQRLPIAREFLPQVIDRPWIAELTLHDTCLLATDIESEEPDTARKLVLEPGLRNPALALRERGFYSSLSFGPAVFVRFVTAAPAEAERLAFGDSKPAQAMRAALTESNSPEAKVIVQIAEAPGLDFPTRGRAATFAREIAARRMTLDAATKLAGNSARFFAAVADLRVQQPGPEGAAYDFALEEVSLMLCREAQESLGRAIGSDLASFRATDLYLLLAYGRGEATPPVFEAVFDRLLLPKLRAEKGKSLLDMLRRSNDLELRDFASSATTAHRFDAFLSVTGTGVLGKLAGGITESADPLKESIRLAQILDATASRDLLQQMAAIIVSEYKRSLTSKNRSGRVLYGMLAARLIDTSASSDAIREIGTPYHPFLKSFAELPLADLFDAQGNSIQRYFFYDDDDGVNSFNSFRKSYVNDPAWKVEDRGDYLYIADHHPGGRHIEIFANIPIDARLPVNKALQNEAQRRQQVIAEVLAQRGVVPKVLVHRGHSFWVQRTLSYVASSDRLVILGSCGGTDEIHKVLEISHDAQVIATRGVGATEVNDPMLKALNDRLLHGAPVLEWSSFWQTQKASLGHTGLFRDYLAPDQDPGSVFLGGYYRAMDSPDPQQ
jgi:hypothetical protein